MADITDLILDDHTWFRARFAALDELRARGGVRPDALRDVWEPLATRLDVHAAAEEEIFYPQLLRHGGDPEDETLDAIGDHNDIRDGVRDTFDHPVGTPGWWDAVGTARVANDEHMAEEEREGLADFRQHAATGLRESLGRRFAEFMDTHRSRASVSTADKDPEHYVDVVEHQIDPSHDGSLGIGGLKEP